MSVHLIHFTYLDSSPSRLAEYLFSALPGGLEKLSLDPLMSKSKVRRLIVSGAVAVNGSQARHADFPLVRGNRVTVRFDEEKFSFEKKPDDIAFALTAASILFEDDDIIVINKPANFPTEATIVGSRDHLHASVKRFLALRDGTRREDIEPYVGLHHRLDRETSGVILFTKKRTANAAVHLMFLEHRTVKHYQALTIRPKKLPPATFSVDNELSRVSAKSAAGKWGAVKTGGEHAHTDFRVMEERKNGLLILAVPLTGRTHQIRVHLAGLGMPLLGDALYGGPERAGAAAGARIMLHAASLTFPHPVTGEMMTVSAPLPDDFTVCLAGL